MSPVWSTWQWQVTKATAGCQLVLYEFWFVICQVKIDRSWSIDPYSDLYLGVFKASHRVCVGLWSSYHQLPSIGLCSLKRELFGTLGILVTRCWWYKCFSCNAPQSLKHAQVPLAITTKQLLSSMPYVWKLAQVIKQWLLIVSRLCPACQTKVRKTGKQMWDPRKDGLKPEGFYYISYPYLLTQARFKKLHMMIWWLLMKAIWVSPGGTELLLGEMPPVCPADLCKDDTIALSSAAESCLIKADGVRYWYLASMFTQKLSHIMFAKLVVRLWVIWSDWPKLLFI